MKTILLSALMVVPVLAGAVSQDDMANQYFSKKTIALTSQERAAISIGKKWQTGFATSKPVAARDGSISYVYGST